MVQICRPFFNKKIFLNYSIGERLISCEYVCVLKFRFNFDWWKGSLKQRWITYCLFFSRYVTPTGQAVPLVERDTYTPAPRVVGPTCVTQTVCCSVIRLIWKKNHTTFIYNFFFTQDIMWILINWNKNFRRVSLFAWRIL